MQTTWLNTSVTDQMILFCIKIPIIRAIRSENNTNHLRARKREMQRRSRARNTEGTASKDLTGTRTLLQQTCCKPQAKEGKWGEEGPASACPAARRPAPIHSARSPGGGRALAAAAPRPEPPCTNLLGSTTSPHPRLLRPLPRAGGTRAGGRPPAGTTGCASPGRGGGAGRARPSAAGPSRAAAGSDTCRAPLPQPPRPLARGRSGARPRPRQASRADPRAVQAEALRLLLALPRGWGQSWAGGPD